MTSLRWPLGLIGALLFIGVALAGPTFPPLTGRVVDDAHVLSPATQSELTSMLAEQERKTGQQVVVVTLPTLQGYTIAQYGYRLGRAWGIGQKGKDNGALLIVAPKEHKVRIEVGYGLEGRLTDVQSELIIHNVIVPKFRAGDYDGGVLAGTRILLRVLGGDASALPPQSSATGQHGHGGFHIGGLLILFLLWILFGRFFWPLFFIGGLSGGFGGGFGGFGGGSGGGFGGGFSGGGGSFGGGGASGSW
ncbi:MAG: TPM domain-containing protein [Rhizomicrobium sp.]